MLLHWSTRARNVLTGLGSALNSCFQPITTRNCQTPKKRPTASSFGHKPFHSRRALLSRRGTGSSSASSPEDSFVRSWSTTAMTAHLLAQLVGDRGRERADGGRVHAARPRDRDRELVHHASRPAGQ